MIYLEFTKSRPRHSGDNGLVESKDGAVIRKQFGYSHIPQEFVQFINTLFNASATVAGSGELNKPIKVERFSGVNLCFIIKKSPYFVTCFFINVF
jgi:hypothetical protein